MVHNTLPRRVLVVDADATTLDVLLDDITNLLATAGHPARRVIADEVPGGSLPAPAPPPVPPAPAPSREPASLPAPPGAGAGAGPASLAGRTVTAGDLVVCVDARVARRAGEALDLTRIEFDLLVELLRHRNRVVTREALLNGVWHHEPVTANAIEARVSRLRAKLERRGPRMIHTVRDVGYVLHVPIEGAGGDRAVLEIVADAGDLVLELTPPGVPWPAGGRH
jgi:DNA-binding winged helix-turn-helix (wHTH) protein